MCKVAKNQDFGYVEGNIMPCTPLNHLCFLAYLFFGSLITFGSHKIQGFRLCKLSKCPKIVFFSAPTTKKKEFTPLNLV